MSQNSPTVFTDEPKKWTYLRLNCGLVMPALLVGLAGAGLWLIASGWFWSWILDRLPMCEKYHVAWAVTVASSFNTHESTRPGELSHPFLLNPEGARTEYEIERSQDPTRPRYDADIGTWVAPFLMGAINTRVVRRSAALYAQCGVIGDTIGARHA